jgi:hypothetical protein
MLHMKKMQFEFKHSGWSFSKYVTEFFDIIPTLTTRIVKPLNLYETRPMIATNRRFFPYFQVHTANLISYQNFSLIYFLCFFSKLPICRIALVLSMGPMCQLQEHLAVLLHGEIEKAPLAVYFYFSRHV